MVVIISYNVSISQTRGLKWVFHKSKVYRDYLGSQFVKGNEETAILFIEVLVIVGQTGMAGVWFGCTALA